MTTHIDGFRVFKYYRALRLHFTSKSYDVFKYRGAIYGLSRDHFEKRKDYQLFEFLARRLKSDQEIVQYFVSNMAYGHASVLYDGFDTGSDYWTAWKRNRESRTRHFEQGLKLLINHLEDLEIPDKFHSTFGAREGSMPILLERHIARDVRVENMVILDHFAGYLDIWEKTKSLNLWNSEFIRIRKTAPFINLDENRLRPVYQSFLSAIRDADES